MAETKEGLYTPVEFNETYISKDLINPHITSITIPKAIIEEKNSELWAYSYNGCGKIVFKNGITYSGSMRYGVMSTEKDPRGCSFAFPNGTKYEGEIKQNQLIGKGTYSFPSGAQYTGDILYGLRHGYGLYTSADGIMYEGEWSRGKKEGMGKMIKGDLLYEGEFKNGLIGGFGKLTWNNGNAYEGQFDNNLINGNGTMHWAETNEKYTGQWKDNLQDGYGVYIWYETENPRYLRNRYVGQWKKGVRNGYGVFFYSNGTKYDGLWENNEKNGFGVFHFLNGSEYIGKFVHDRMIDYDALGLVNTINTNNELFTNPDKAKNGKAPSGAKQSQENRKDELELPLINKGKNKVKRELEIIFENETLNKTTKVKQQTDQKPKDKEKKAQPNASSKPQLAKPQAKKGKTTNAEQASSEKVKTTNQFTKKTTTAPRSIKETSISFLASNHVIIESETNQFKSMIDIMDILETSTTIEETSKEIENALLRNLSEMKHWYHKLIRGEKGEDMAEANYSRMGAFRLEEPQIDLNALDEKMGTEMNMFNPDNASQKDDKIGICMEMKDIWRFFRDYGIVSVDMSIAQFNRLFYKGPKNIVEMFYLPEEIPRIRLYDYMYLMISKAHRLFKDKHAKDLEDLSMSKVDKRKLTSSEMFNYYDTDAHIDQDLIAFDYHNPHNTVLVRQFYEAIVRAAYLRFYDYCVPIYSKIEMLISKFSMKNANKSARIKTVNRSNTSNSALSNTANEISTPLNPNTNIITPDQRQKNAEHSLIDAFVLKYEIAIKPIFRKMCSKYVKNANRAPSPTDMIITYRYLLSELIMKSPLLRSYYPDKKAICEVVNYYFREKRNDLSLARDLYEYYELLLDLELTFYEFCEWMHFLSQKHLKSVKAKEGEEPAVIAELIKSVKEVAYVDNEKIIISRPAKYKLVYPILYNHIVKQKLIDERLRREREELLKRLEKERYMKERKLMEIEAQTNAYIEEIPQEDEEDDQDNSYY